MSSQTQPTVAHSLSPLERCALEILEQIVLFAIEERLIGPPSDLLALLTTSKTINFALSPQKNSGLCAKIFRLKFDTAAASRRLTPRWLTSKCLATELRLRFEAFQRIRSRVTDGFMLQYDLWTVFLILLEHDRKNALQLTEWAQAHTFAILVAKRWSTNGYRPEFGESLGGLVCTIIWELVREGQLCRSCATPGDYFDTQSTPADLTEVLRRWLRDLLYVQVLCGYRVGGFSVVAPKMSLTNAIVFFVLCLRRVLYHQRTARRIKRASTRSHAHVHASPLLWAYPHDRCAPVSIGLSVRFYGRHAA
jgi:hypothetical protein